MRPCSHISSISPASCSSQELEEEEDEYGNAPSVFSLKRNPFASAGSAAGPKDGGDHHLHPPPTYTEQHATACVTAIRSLARNWLQLLCRVGTWGVVGGGGSRG